MKQLMKAAVPAVVLSAMMFQAGSLYGQERAMHPRLSAAIVALQDARTYLNAAPHDFGGHRVAAVGAIDAALNQLNLALQYRGAVDGRRQ